MELKNFEKHISTTLYIIIIVAVIVFMVVTVVKMFAPQKEDLVRLEVVGITDSINASTLTSLHYECVKFCADRYANDYSTKQCFDACASLGREGCKT